MSNRKGGNNTAANKQSAIQQKKVLKKKYEQVKGMIKVRDKYDVELGHATQLQVDVFEFYLNLPSTSINKTFNEINIERKERGFMTVIPLWKIIHSINQMKRLVLYRL